MKKAITNGEVSDYQLKINKGGDELICKILPEVIGNIVLLTINDDDIWVKIIDNMFSDSNNNNNDACVWPEIAELIGFIRYHKKHFNRFSDKVIKHINDSIKCFMSYE